MFVSVDRVDPETKIVTLRDEIDQQLSGSDIKIPREYVFLKSVGRSLTRVSLVLNVKALNKQMTKFMSAKFQRKVCFKQYHIEISKTREQTV